MKKKGKCSMKHVSQKMFKLITFHWCLISYPNYRMWWACRAIDFIFSKRPQLITFLYLPPNFLSTLSIIKLLDCHRNQCTYNCISRFIDDPCYYVLKIFSRFTMLQSESPKGTIILYLLFFRGTKTLFPCYTWGIYSKFLKRTYLQVA